jgi:hypothetical protein
MACTTARCKTYGLSLTSRISSEYRKRRIEKSSSYNRTRSRDAFENGFWCCFCWIANPMTTQPVGFLHRLVLMLFLVEKWWRKLKIAPVKVGD